MFQGVLTALITPFRDGKLDERALAEFVNWQIEAGVDGLVPCGSSGESATMSHAEHRRVVEIVVATAAGRVPVVAGTGSNSTSEAIELTRHAKEAGADGALLISPYYNKPTQAGIVAHYEAVANETQFPLMIYNIEGRTASNLLPETIARLAAHPHIVGVKEASGSLDQVAHIIASCPDDFSVLSGDDALVLPLLSLGGRGVICTTSNVVPRRMTELVRAFQSGDIAGAQKIHYELLPLFDTLFCETNPIPVKAAVAMMGKIDGEIRLPLTPLSDTHRERLQWVMKEAGLL